MDQILGVPKYHSFLFIFNLRPFGNQLLAKGNANRAITPKLKLTRLDLFVSEIDKLF